MCDFCDPLVIEKQGIYFNDLAGIIYPQKPTIFGNVMIIPKRHVELFHELSDGEIVEMRNLVAKLFNGFKEKYHATGFNLINNNGKSGNQHVPHVHWHILMRFDDEEYSPYDVLNGKVERENISIGDEEWENRKKQVIELL
jgi:diadenosine tetraphosphate (Ap4A) HIT family hydrolase